MLLVSITYGSDRRQNTGLAHASPSVWMVFLFFKASGLSRWLEARNLSALPNWYTRFVMMYFEVCRIGICNSCCLPSRSHQMILVLYQMLILLCYCSREVDKYYP